MNELDMSRPGTELFPESAPMQYNSYQDVNIDQVVDDPLNTGVTVDAADQNTTSDLICFLFSSNTFLVASSCFNVSSILFALNKFCSLSSSVILNSAR